MLTIAINYENMIYLRNFGCERYQIRSCCFSMFANVFADFGWVVLPPEPPCPWMGLLYILTSCKLEPCPPERVHRMILIIHDHRKSMETMCDM